MTGARLRFELLVTAKTADHTRQIVLGGERSVVFFIAQQGSCRKKTKQFTMVDRKRFDKVTTLDQRLKH